MVTGRPADTLVAMTFRWTPDWTWLLLLFGIVPFFIAAHFATVEIPARLPVARDTLGQYGTQRRSVWLGIIAGVALIIAAAAGQLPVLAWLGLAAWLVAGAALIVVNLWWVGVAPAQRRGDVTLRRVHPRFAQELRSEGDVQAGRQTVR